MAFFDKVMDTAKNLGDKAGGAIETTKQHARISSEKSAIQGLYQKLGELCYQGYASGEGIPSEATSLCAEIDARYAVIEEIKAEAAE